MGLKSSMLAQLSQSRAFQAARDLPLRLRAPDSYSQHGEDLYILENLLADRANSGIYVDIGASHPARLSNTYLLYKKGWRGLVVEPIAALADLQRRWRPNDTQVQCLIGDVDGVADFYQLYPSVLSTTSRSELDYRLESGSVLLRQDRLPQLTLSTLLSRHLPGSQVNFMSVDVEGVDTLLARQISVLPADIRPEILCIEGNSPEIQKELTGTLSTVYDQLHVLGCNLIFWNARKN